MARCLPACCEANRRRPVFPPFTSAFGPGLHVLSGGVGEGRTPVAVLPGGGMDGPRPGRPQRRRRARVRKGPRSPSGPRPLRLRRQGRRHRRRRAPRHPRRFEGMSVRGRTMARGTAAFRRGEPAAPAPGGGSGQPCREWTMGSHSPGLRRAARRCSSRERGDWPGPAGRACTGGRRQERGRRASAWT